MPTAAISTRPPGDQPSTATATPPRWVRLTVPALLLIGWLVVGTVGGPCRPAGRPSAWPVVFMVLALLLRALVAPVLLIATVVLSFAATLGVSALVFNHLLDFPGADPATPLFAFVFLVALGIDYNIFLMTRVREEALTAGTRAGTLHGLAVTGGVITSAGVVLAATFGALSVLPILFLAQIAFMVAFGVLLDALVVRSLLVPALTVEIGPRVWWPARMAVHKS